MWNLFYLLCLTSFRPISYSPRLWPSGHALFFPSRFFPSSSSRKELHLKCSFFPGSGWQIDIVICNCELQSFESLVMSSLIGPCSPLNFPHSLCYRIGEFIARGIEIFSVETCSRWLLPERGSSFRTQFLQSLRHPPRKKSKWKSHSTGPLHLPYLHQGDDSQ